MIKCVDGNKTAIIVLHEIYGINNFIKEICSQYNVEGYDVFCPNLLNLEYAFPYSKEGEAYSTFTGTVGFDVYKEINLLATSLKMDYSKIIIIGFSVGATIAWRCSEQLLYDGIICCYGSRIRDYLTVNPICPVLLIFAKYDSFDVAESELQLRNKKNTAIEVFEASHGFVDFYSKNFSKLEAEMFNKQRKSFFADLTV